MEYNQLITVEIIGRSGETRAGARSPTGKVTDVKQLVRHDAATAAGTVTNNHLVVHCLITIVFD